MFGYWFVLGAPQAALGAAAGELSGNTVQPGPAGAAAPLLLLLLLLFQLGAAGGAVAVADSSALSQGSKSYHQTF